MSRVRLWQLGLIAGAFLLLELLCRTRVIDPFTMIPPTQMVVGLFEAAANKPWFWPDVSYTLFNIAAAVAISAVDHMAISQSRAAARRAGSRRPQCVPRLEARFRGVRKTEALGGVM